MMLQLIDNKKNFYFYFFIFLFLTTINFNFNNSKNLISFKINDISVEGLSHKNNVIIEQKLNIFKDMNIFTFSKEESKKILDQFSIIGSYEIKKIYPNKIEVKLKKTNFLAFTYLENNKYIIGENDKLISLKYSAYNDLDLPLVLASNNYKKFFHLKKTIDESKFNSQEI